MKYLQYALIWCLATTGSLSYAEDESFTNAIGDITEHYYEQTKQAVDKLYDNTLATLETLANPKDTSLKFYTYVENFNAGSDAAVRQFNRDALKAIMPIRTLLTQELLPPIETALTTAPDSESLQSIKQNIQNLIEGTYQSLKDYRNNLYRLLGELIESVQNKNLETLINNIEIKDVELTTADEESYITSYWRQAKNFAKETYNAAKPGAVKIFNDTKKQAVEKLKEEGKQLAKDTGIAARDKAKEQLANGYQAVKNKLTGN